MARQNSLINMGFGALLQGLMGIPERNARAAEAEKARQFAAEQAEMNRAADQQAQSQRQMHDAQLQQDRFSEQAAQAKAAEQARVQREQLEANAKTLDPVGRGAELRAKGPMGTFFSGPTGRQAEALGGAGGQLDFKTPQMPAVFSGNRQIEPSVPPMDVAGPALRVHDAGHARPGRACPLGYSRFSDYD